MSAGHIWTCGNKVPCHLHTTISYRCVKAKSQALFPRAIHIVTLPHNPSSCMKSQKYKASDSISLSKHVEGWNMEVKVGRDQVHSTFTYCSGSSQAQNFSRGFKHKKQLESFQMTDDSYFRSIFSSNKKQQPKRTLSFSQNILDMLYFLTNNIWWYVDKNWKPLLWSETC